MKLSYAWIGCAGAALLLAGCGPKIAETPLGAEDQQWQQTIQASYPGWQPPRVAAPAVKGNLDENFVNPAAAAAADSGEPVVETAAAEPAVEPAAETTGVPAASADSDVVVVAPAEDTKTAEAAAPAADAKTAEAAAPAADAKTADAAAPAEEKYEEYVVVKGDSLSKIAQKFYKNGNRFPVLIKANEDVLKGNPNRLRVGMKLRIPAL